MTSPSPAAARRRLLPATVAVLTVVLFAAGYTAYLASPNLPGDDADWSLSAIGVPVLAFGVVGYLLTTRVPGNPVGPLCAAVALLFATTTASSGISAWGLRTGSLPQLFAEYLDCLAAVWVFAVGILGIHLPLRLPDGRLPSPRWRWFSRAMNAVLVLGFVSQAALPGLVELVPGTSNPLGTSWAQPLSMALFVVFLGMAVGVAAIVLHYRRGSAVQRAQLQWVAFGGIVFVVLEILLIFGAEFFPQEPRVTFVLNFATAVGFAVLPVCIGIAVLRRGLYDLGVVVRRTVVYTALTVLLAGAYVGTVLLP